MIVSSIPRDAMLGIAQALYGTVVSDALRDLDGLDGATDLWTAYRAVSRIASVQASMAEASARATGTDHGDGYLSVSVAPCGFHVEIKPWKAARMRLSKTLADLEPVIGQDSQ